MSSTAQSLAGKRIYSLLDENSFVEIGGCVTARNTDFNLSEKETPRELSVKMYSHLQNLRPYKIPWHRLPGGEYGYILSYS